MGLECKPRDVLHCEPVWPEDLECPEEALQETTCRVASLAFVLKPESSMRKRRTRWPTYQDSWFGRAPRSLEFAIQESFDVAGSGSSSTQAAVESEALVVEIRCQAHAVACGAGTKVQPPEAAEDA